MRGITAKMALRDIAQGTVRTFLAALCGVLLQAAAPGPSWSTDWLVGLSTCYAKHCAA